MSRKVRYKVEFEMDEDIFENVDDDEIASAVEEKMPSDCRVGKCYYKNLSGRGKKPYVSVMVNDTMSAVDDLVERNEGITEAVLTGVEGVVGEEHTSKTIEGWS